MVYLHCCCNLYRLPVASLTAGFEYQSHNGEFLCDVLWKLDKGTSPVIIETSVPCERERDITVVAMITARPANRRSVSESDIIVAGFAFILP